MKNYPAVANSKAHERNTTCFRGSDDTYWGGDTSHPINKGIKRAKTNYFAGSIIYLSELVTTMSLRRWQ